MRTLSVLLLFGSRLCACFRLLNDSFRPQPQPRRGSIGGRIHRTWFVKFLDVIMACFIILWHYFPGEITWNHENPHEDGCGSRVSSSGPSEYHTVVLLLLLCFHGNTCLIALRYKIVANCQVLRNAQIHIVVCIDGALSSVSQGASLSARNKMEL
jgi:hypothetical protein